MWAVTEMGGKFTSRACITNCSDVNLFLYNNGKPLVRNAVVDDFQKTVSCTAPSSEIVHANIDDCKPSVAFSSDEVHL